MRIAYGCRLYTDSGKSMTFKLYEYPMWDTNPNPPNPPISSGFNVKINFFFVGILFILLHCLM
jgi:hypothetical protein